MKKEEEILQMLRKTSKNIGFLPLKINSNDEITVLRKKYEDGHFNVDLLSLLVSYFPDLNSKQCGLLLERIKDTMIQVFEETSSE